MIFRSFILQAPLALLCCIACVVLLSSGQHIEESCENTDQTDQKPRKVDYLGIGTFTIMITSLFAAIWAFWEGKARYYDIPNLHRCRTLLWPPFSADRSISGQGTIDPSHSSENCLGNTFPYPDTTALGPSICMSSPLFFVLQKHSRGHWWRAQHVSSLAPYFL